MTSKVIPRIGRPFNLSQNKRKPQITIWHKLIFLSPIFVIILIFKGNEWYNNYQLSNNGIETLAKITKVSNVGVRDPVEVENVEFEFKYRNSLVKGYSLAKINGDYAISDNEMPLFIGDEFTLRYVKNNPEIYLINYNNPSKKTIEKYINITSISISNINLYQKGPNQKKQCECLSKNIFQKLGIDGLSSLFFNNELIIENIKHNSITFKNFITKKEVLQIINNCKQ